MYVVSAHRVYAVRLPVHYILIVEKELVCFHKLSLTLAEFIGNDAVLKDVAEF